MPEISLPTKSVQDIIKQTTDQILAAVNAKNTSKILRKKVFTTNGVFNVPSGVTEVLITGGGAGGGGTSVPSVGATLSGVAGTDTEFGTLLTLKGGKGGSFSGGVAIPGASGGSGGESGQANDVDSFTTGRGGNSGFFFGGSGSESASALPDVRNGNFCSGGAAYAVTQRQGGGGGGGEFVHQLPIAVTPLTSIPITLGIGGAGGNLLAGRGGNGWLAVEWWE